MKLHLFLVLKIYGVKKIARGGWPGFWMVTVGMDPNTFEVLNGHPNKIPTDKILGGVVQNCLSNLLQAEGPLVGPSVCWSQFQIFILSVSDLSDI